MIDDTILEASNLGKSFRGFDAVRGVNLRVKRGSIHALIGPNGAGKTTCFNLLTRFLPVTSGRIVFDGRDITPLDAASVARLGLVRSFQNSAVFRQLDVLDNVRVALLARDRALRPQHGQGAWLGNAIPVHGLPRLLRTPALAAPSNMASR